MSLSHYISATETKQLYDNGIKIIDIRTPGEFQTLHIPKSINIPLNQIDQLQYIKDKVLVLLCHAGVRTINNQEIFEHFTQAQTLYILEHGILEWIENGFPVTANNHLS